MVLFLHTIAVMPRIPLTPAKQLAHCFLSRMNSLTCITSASGGRHIDRYNPLPLPQFVPLPLLVLDHVRLQLFGWTSHHWPPLPMVMVVMMVMMVIVDKGEGEGEREGERERERERT